jgi:hypothetical protein
VEVTGLFLRLRPLLPTGPTEVTGSIAASRSLSVQLQVSDILLDPGLLGVSTNLPASLG